MKPRWKILIAIGLLLVLVATGMVMTTHVQPEREVEAYKKSLRAWGEKLEVSDLVHPPVVSEDNCKDIVEAAFKTIGEPYFYHPNSMYAVAPGRAIVAWQQEDVRNDDFTNSWDEFGMMVDTYRPAIELLREVLNRPKLDFHLDYGHGFGPLLSYHTSMSSLVQSLEIASILDLHKGDAGAATTNILILLALIDKDSSERMLVSFSMRKTWTDIAVIPTWELLQATNSTDTQLALVQAAWEHMDFFTDAESSFEMERAWITKEIRKIRASQGFVGSGRPGASGSGAWSWPMDWNAITEKPRDAVGEAMWRYSWSYSDELHYLKTGQLMLGCVRTMRTNSDQFFKKAYDSTVTQFAAIGFTNHGEVFFHVLKIPDISEDIGRGDLFVSTLHGALKIETARRIVVTAIALKRYQLAHRRWPQTIGDLAPEFLASVPIDPYDGKPLKYRPNNDGTFLLYSVAENGVDDGGDPSSGHGFQDSKARDWVWPQPASPADVQNFYEHPPK